METFAQRLTASIGSAVDVVLPGQVYQGTLENVTHIVMQVSETLPIEYVPPGATVSIAIDSVDYVRIMAS